MYNFCIFVTCGTPVITTNVTSIPEIVQDGAITIGPYDNEALIKNIYNVLSDVSLREELTRRGLERAYKFSWKKTAIETIKVYEELYRSY